MFSNQNFFLPNLETWGPFTKKSYYYDTHLGHLHPLRETPPAPLYANKLELRLHLATLHVLR